MEAKHIQPAQQFSVDHENLLLKVYHRYLDYLDSQAKNHLLWFFLALMIHGVFFLASPAILIWFYDAPILVIAITIVILKDFYDIDKCLDSSGKWNPKSKVCEK